MSDVDAAVAAIRAGKPAVIPTDTVYGLVADPYRDEPARPSGNGSPDAVRAPREAPW